MSKPQKSPFLANKIEEAGFESEGLAELLRLTGWTPESAILESAAMTAMAVSRTLRRGVHASENSNNK